MLKDKLIIRNFKKQDLGKCIKIIQGALGKSIAKDALVDLLEGLNPKTQKYSFLKRRVAEVNGEVIAIVGAYRLKSHNPDLMGVGWLVVDKKFQKTGLGTRLLKWVLKETRKKNKKYLFVWSTKRAKSFYNRFNFKESNMKIRPKESKILLVKRMEQI